jgi:hypothetical protein
MLQVFGHSQGKLEASWLTADGAEKPKSVKFTANQVVNVDLGTVPKGVSGVKITSESAVNVAAVVTAKGANGQEDVSSLIPSEYSTVSAITLPQTLSGSIVIANVIADAAGSSQGAQSAGGSQVTIDGFDASGKLVRSMKEIVPLDSALNVALSKFGKEVRALRLTSSESGASGASGKGVRWSFLASSPKLSDAHVAGVSVLQPIDLIPQSVMVTSYRSQLTVS